MRSDARGGARRSAQRRRRRVCVGSAALAAAMLALGAWGTAAAATHNVCLDFELGNDLFDASRAGGSGQSCGSSEDCTISSSEICPPNGFQCTEEKSEDHGRDEGTRPFPAMRVLARVLDEDLFIAGSPLAVQWGWEMLDDDGCTGSFETDATTFLLQYEFWSENPAEQDPADRNFVLGYTCSGMPNLSSCEQQRQEISSITPSGGGDTIVTRQLDGEAQLPHATHYPFWSTVFSEFRVGQPDLLDAADYEHVYVVTDRNAAFQNGTASGFRFGGHPTIFIKGNGWHSKWTAAHEHGHVVTQFLGIDGFGPQHFDYDYDGEGAHSLDSMEWQSGAVVEGLADFYALAVWNDVDAIDDNIYLNFTAIGPNLVVLARLVDTVGGSALCQPSTCGAGVAAERDWMIALRALHQNTSLSVADVLQMPVVAHDDDCTGLDETACNMTSGCTWSTHATDACVGWPVSGATQDFWDNFDTAMQSYLTAGEKIVWDNESDRWNIDQ